jgi:hypothetical protein
MAFDYDRLRVSHGTTAGHEQISKMTEERPREFLRLREMPDHRSF